MAAAPLPPPIRLPETVSDSPLLLLLLLGGEEDVSNGEGTEGNMFPKEEEIEGKLFPDREYARWIKY